MQSAFDLNFQVSKVSANRFALSSRVMTGSLQRSDSVLKQFRLFSSFERLAAFQAAKDLCLSIGLQSIRIALNYFQLSSTVFDRCKCCRCARINSLPAFA